MLDKPLPITKQEMHERGWSEPDFVLVTGDAYVDHPSFGAALISRVLVERGYRVGIVPQPNWNDVEDFRVLGAPRLAFLITAGNVDSMVNLYTANRNFRTTDSYSPGGVAGMRPKRALLVYTTCVRQAYKNIPVIVGGLEASLRRFSHYDYWSDKVRKSILLDAKADVLVYGMGETPIVEIADRLHNGSSIADITDVRGTVYRSSSRGTAAGKNGLILPSYEEVRDDTRRFAESFMIQYKNSDPHTAYPLVEPTGNSLVIQNPPAFPLTQEEMDRIYELPFSRRSHPVYTEQGGIPAQREVTFSLTSSRGCFGECSFCALTYHQGTIVQSRSHQSLLREAETLTRFPDFKGYIHDVGGPTANFRHPACKKQYTRGSCSDRDCLFPEHCPNLHVDHSDLITLLKKLRSLPGIKKVFIRSGIRFDYLMADQDDTFFRELCEHHISGQLKVAPEHISARVLGFMGKPDRGWFDRFARKYREINRQLHKKQYLVPYFIAAHPGATLEDALEVAEYLRDFGFIPEQIQDFYPTPGTLATCMYHTELDPRTMKSIPVAKGKHQRALHRALIQFNDPKNYSLVREALGRIGRTDLIGNAKHCLIPDRPAKKKQRRR